MNKDTYDYSKSNLMTERSTQLMHEADMYFSSNGATSQNIQHFKNKFKNVVSTFSKEEKSAYKKNLAILLDNIRLSSQNMGSNIMPGYMTNPQPMPNPMMNSRINPYTGARFPMMPGMPMSLPSNPAATMPISMKAMNKDEIKDLLADKDSKVAFSKLGEDYKSMVQKYMSSYMTDNEDFSLWMDFGQMNSHIYRNKLWAVFKVLDLSTNEVWHIVKCAVCVKNKSRIIEALETSFKDEVWYPNVMKFYKNYTVQYNTDRNTAKTRAMFPVVALPGCCVTLVCSIFLTLMDKATMTDEEIYERMKENLWFGQLSLDKRQQEEHMRWEKNFWENVVTTTKSTHEIAEPGKRFNEEFYKSKRSDKYPLMLGKDKIMVPSSEEGYTKKDILDWINGHMFTTSPS
jgi:hypothetical protein